MSSKTKPPSSPYAAAPCSPTNRFGAIFSNLDAAEGLLEIISAVADSVNSSGVDDTESQTRLWRGIQTLQMEIYNSVAAARDTADRLQTEILGPGASETGGGR